MLAVRGVFVKGEIKLKERVSFSREIPVIVTFLEDIDEAEIPVKKYRISDLAGKLEWDGDAVKEQRSLRDE